MSWPSWSRWTTASPTRSPRPRTCRWPRISSTTWPAGPPRSRATRSTSRCPTCPGANFHSYTLREPLGVVGQIIPWNFPLLMAAWKLGPALATGNCVVLKPAEQTPLTALRLAELIAEAGMPDGVVNVVPGFGETAGSGPGRPQRRGQGRLHRIHRGRQAHRAGRGASNLKKLTLELGGKSPNIVFDDAEPARYRGCGQRDLLQPRPVLRGGLSPVRPAGQVRRGRGGRRGDRQVHQDGTGNGTRDADGPAGLRRAVPPGDRLPGVRQGRRRHRPGRRRTVRRPWLLRRAHRAHQHQPGHEGRARGDLRAGLGRRRRSRDLDEIAAVANDTEYGLGAGIWTKDISKAHALAKKIRAGTVWINCYNVFDAALPFGGYKQSGWGREMGHEALNAYTEVKAVTAQL